MPSHTLPSHRIPSLDGLRAISILFVIAGHVILTVNVWRGAAVVAVLGVKIFFVISGFLITGLLVGEWGQVGKISLRNFYLRRSLRIFPLAYFYIGIVALLSVAGILKLNQGDLAAAATYTMSYHQLKSSASLVHLWSLSVEEQFYLLWPPVIAFMGLRTASLIALTMVLGMPLLRAGIWILLPERRDLFSVQMLSSVDALAFGCLGALWADAFKKIGEKVNDFTLMSLIPVMIFLLAYPLETLPIPLRRIWRGSEDSAVHFLILLMLAGCIYGSRASVYKLLNSKAMISIGVLSYALYIWQELFTLGGLTRPLVGVLLTFVAAYISHVTIERPFLRLKERFQSNKLAASQTSAN